MSRATRRSTPPSSCLPRPAHIRATASRRRARLVMILHEARELVLVVESGVKVLPYRLRLTIAKPIVQSFVVRVVEPLLLHGPLEVPIDFRDKAEARNSLADMPDRVRPEQRRTSAPGSFKDVWQYQHCHVAPHTVTLARDLHQLGDHRVLSGWIAVVELQGVGPPREVRVAPVRQQQ